MIKKLFILFKIARKLALSDALKVISKFHQPPLIIKIFLGLFSISFSKNNYQSNRLTDEEKLCASIQEMGTTFIKLGQFLSTRPDIIGEDLSTQLEKLQDRLPPFSTYEAKEIIKKNLGNEIFDSIINFSEPIAAASIAQVHKAQINDDGIIKDVAIKILRPNIKKTFNDEIDALMLLAYLIESLISKGALNLVLDLRDNPGGFLQIAEQIADEFLEQMIEIAKQIKIGDPLLEETQMGPLCTIGQLENIENEVSLAINEGGRILHGGKRPKNMDGLFYEPTIISCNNQNMKIVDTELFGPVLSVLKFRTEEEVINLANDTVHGLAAGIFTRDSARSLRMAKAVKAGIVWVNTYRVVSPIAEFGGIKGSGYGRESGFQAMYDYTRPKTIWMNTSDEPFGNPFVMR